MAIPSTGQVKFSDVYYEIYKQARTSGALSLKNLSLLTTKNTAPYGINEFHSYNHTINIQIDVYGSLLYEGSGGNYLEGTLYLCNSSYTQIGSMYFDYESYGLASFTGLAPNQVYYIQYNFLLLYRDYMGISYFETYAYDTTRSATLTSLYGTYFVIPAYVDGANTLSLEMYINEL